MKLPENYVISKAALDAVRRHANSARPGWEIGGALRVEEDRFVGYRRIENVAGLPGWFEPAGGRWHRGEPEILLHSHPGENHVGHHISRGDVDYMVANDVQAMAIFVPALDRIFVWWLTDLATRSVQAVPVIAEQRPPSRARPLRRPGRRGLTVRRS